MNFKTALVYGLVFLGTTSAQVIGNGCVNFVLAAGTGCAWMCQYCANALGTANYYFTDSVCTYQTGGCAGNPQAGVTYTCCSV